MTENEAINILQLNRPFAYSELQNAVDMAIKALEKQSMVNEILHELKEYSLIGTIEEFKALKEKSEPKEVAYQIDTSGHKHEKCPTCGSFHVFGNYCTKCGQKLDWQ